MRKPAFCICKKQKGAGQLHSNIKANYHLCFRYIHVDSAIPLLPKSEISSLLPSSVFVQPVLCRTWLKIGLLMMWLKL